MQPDPELMANLISTAIKERNPFILFTKEVGRMMHVLTHLKENMQTSRQRVQQLQYQQQQIQACIEGQNPSSGGSKLNTTR